MVHGLGNLSYEERLEAMDLASLAYRRLRGDAMQQLGIYKFDSLSMLRLAGLKTFETKGHWQLD